MRRASYTCVLLSSGFSGDIIYRDVRVEECILDDFDLARVSEPLSYTISRVHSKSDISL